MPWAVPQVQMSQPRQVRQSPHVCSVKWTNRNDVGGCTSGAKAGHNAGVQAGGVWLRHRILTCSLPSWDTIVIKRERLQRHQPGQHGSLLWAMLALAVPNRQMCQAAEQDIQLQVSHHPAA